MRILVISSSPLAAAKCSAVQPGRLTMAPLASKAGCEPADTLALCRQLQALPGLKLRGLMALPAPLASGGDAHGPFRLLRHLFEQLQAENMSVDTLSMGMSDDLEIAIAEGSTLIRVGSALFGARPAGKTLTNPSS